MKSEDRFMADGGNVGKPKSIKVRKVKTPHMTPGGDFGEKDAYAVIWEQKVRRFTLWSTPEEAEAAAKRMRRKSGLDAFDKYLINAANTHLENLVEGGELTDHEASQALEQVNRFLEGGGFFKPVERAFEHFHEVGLDLVEAARDGNLDKWLAEQQEAP